MHGIQRDSIEGEEMQRLISNDEESALPGRDKPHPRHSVDTSDPTTLERDDTNYRSGSLTELVTNEHYRLYKGRFFGLAQLVLEDAQCHLAGHGQQRLDRVHDLAPPLLREAGVDERLHDPRGDARDELVGDRAQVLLGEREELDDRGRRQPECDGRE